MFIFMTAPLTPGFSRVSFSRSSYKEVHVRLGDMNDHPPVFNRDSYEVRVLESALINTPLTRLKVPTTLSFTFTSNYCFPALSLESSGDVT